MFTEQKNWSPTQWETNEDDWHPDLPSWSATIDMIDSAFTLAESPGLMLSNARRPVSGDERVPTIKTIAYGCLRGLTVEETMRYFGKWSRAACAAGECHPVRDIESLISDGKGGEPMALHVSFLGGANPLMERAAP